MTYSRILHRAALLLVMAAGVEQAQFEVRYDFGSNSGDGVRPTGIIAQGRDGNFYGTTPIGGVNGFGTVFRISSGTLSTLFSFGGQANGGNPYGGLTLGSDGNLYGTTALASGHLGTIFKIGPGGHITTLYSFNGSDGASPHAPPVQGTDGSFYGTTYSGANMSCHVTSGCGTVYKLTASGLFTTLYQFDGAHGANPVAPLVQGADGNFYGTTRYGGSQNDGIVFRITRTGKLMVLRDFSAVDGADLQGPLVQGRDGGFYGTTVYGGTSGFGVVFRITPAGSFTVLHNMNGTTDGGWPVAGLVQATDGNVYGVNSTGGSNSSCNGAPCGTIFEITPTGTYEVLYNFDGTTGADPVVTPFQHTNGIIYGDTSAGGTGSGRLCATGTCGVFYSVNASLRAFVSLLPYSGKVGKTIEFLGQGFTGTTGVSFNGTSATFSVKSATYLTATVPNGATTGFVTVTTPGGTLKSNKKFRVIP
jgi:uncharacterized repeat protein (TIGR03803 family)